MRLIYRDVDGLQRLIDRYEATLDRLTESLSALSTRVVVWEYQVNELRKTEEEKRRRFWAFLGWFLVGLFSSLITSVSIELLFYFSQK